MQYVKYFFYLLRHKWFVLLECTKRGLFWRGITHDLSKFRFDEFIPFANYFYGKKRQNDLSFFKAKRLHEERNGHHWECWIMPSIIGRKISHGPIPMPASYQLEMLCDLLAMERIGGVSVSDWYAKRKDQIRLHPETRAWLEKQIAQL